MKKAFEFSPGPAVLLAGQLSLFKRAFCPAKLLLQFFFILVATTPLYTSAAETANSYLTAALGIEQLTYKEQIPDLALRTSETDITNWVLYLEGRKALRNIFFGTRGEISLTSEEARENWSRAGEFEQTNTLAYRQAGISGHVGFFPHRRLNPYIGIKWNYARQERGDFENVNTPGTVDQTATETVNSFSALVGILGSIPFSGKWSFSYFAEYLLPFYSRITNDSLPGWKASNVGGYTVSLTGRLNYAFSETITGALQIRWGRRHWQGSDWAPVGDSRVKWPENNTDFLGGFFCVSRYF